MRNNKMNRIEGEPGLQLMWNGKQEAIEAANAAPTTTLVPNEEDSIDFEHTKNLYIEGDKLEIIKNLKETHSGKVKMIFLDPPYIKMPDAELPHTKWLNMMYPYLKVSRDLLTEDGVIFVCIDDAEVANLRLILNEIYGDFNFEAQFVLDKTSARPALSAANVRQCHEYVVCYAKNGGKLQFNKMPKSSESFENLKQDEKGYFILRPLQTSTNFSESRVYEIEDKDGNKYLPEAGTSWRYTKEHLEEHYGELCFQKGKVYVKFYIDDMGPASSVINMTPNMGIGASSKELQELGMQPGCFTRSTDFVRHFIKMATGGDDIILDFFCGWATTAHAVLLQNFEDGGNRTFIIAEEKGITPDSVNMFKSQEIVKKRIKSSIESVRIKLDIKNYFTKDSEDKENPKTFDLGLKMMETKEIAG